jgi:hypothetical protein
MPIRESAAGVKLSETWYYTRIIDQNVDGSDFIGDPCDALLAGIEIRNVDRVGARRAPDRLARTDGLLAFRYIVP